MKVKSQSSMEFLVIFGISFTLILLLGSLFFSYSSGAKSELDQRQIEKFAGEMITNIEKVYFLGQGNRVTMKTRFPNGIENFSIIHINSSNPSNPGSSILFDQLSVTYYFEDQIVNNLFETRDFYIRFNCTACSNSANVGGNWTSYFNSSDFSGGAKQIRIESMGDWVNIYFYKGD
ncbi:MAG: hypothetical protein KC589_04585 [Nanoarchaeota archaeon]|nr:hypothetical protein [Nanoarchaeota archaeon]